MTSHLTRPRLSPELLAMALDSYSYDCCVFPPLLDWEWDWGELDTLGLGGVAEAGGTAVQEQEAVFFPATPGVESPASSEASSGYLQDAVAHWSGRCNKRQRMEATPPPRRPATVGEDLQFLLESFWDSSAEGGGGDGDLRQDLNTTIPETEICCSFVSGEEKRGVMYPFDVVKPLGLDAGRMTTLDDVNQRILKRPARPVRHPVGPFACGPAVTAHGIGLSGKAVVSLTKIRTGGKGTITIIRTRD
ncbi:uncharacterized protein LOC120643464 isoform X2 [Panicum virgatum]|uniref:uncharacterized protein LOC120643464 isoform X2 n=1 Tax=Panicum virgatum TaxID=38727 RepID=UPI0019D69AB2|nr:uncharacterized protein LOC120643464 isoform X2 [Panicum virgatum]